MATTLTATTPGPTFQQTLFTLVVGAAVGASAVWLLSGPSYSAHRPEVLPAAPRAGRISYTHGAGWYLLLWSDPPGNRDRRFKGTSGPFATKREAEAAMSGEWMWSPTVRFFKSADAAERAGEATDRRRTRSRR